MLIVTLSICSCNSEKKNDLKEKNLKGRVKYVEEKNYSVIDNFGEIDKGKLVSLFTFNKDGNILYAIESIYKKNLYMILKDIESNGINISRTII